MSERRGRFGILVLALLVAVGATAVSVMLVEPFAPCDSDEGHHTVSALTYQRDVLDGDLRGFVRHTLSTGRYPFFHGWYGAAATLVFGPSLFVLRASSSVLLGLAAGLAVLLLRRLDPKIHPLWLIGAGLVIALAPENHANSVLCMLEIPGLALALLAGWLYHRFLDRPDRAIRGLLTGLTLVALLFVKYPYGAYLFVPIAVHEALRLGFRPSGLFGRPSLAVWGPFVGALAIWLVIPQSRAGVLKLIGDAPDAITNEGGRDPGAIPYVQPELVWYYLRTLTEKLTPGAVSPWPALLGWLLVLGCGVHAFTGGRFGRIVLLGSVVWTVFTLTLSFRTFGVDRFLIPVGGTFVVAGIAGLARLWRHVLSRKDALFVGARVLGTALLLVASLLAAIDVRDIEHRAREAVETDEYDGKMVAWIRDALPGPGNLLLVGAWDQVCEDGLRTNVLLADPASRIPDLDVKAIRRGRLYRGTGRLVRWFEEESRWRPPGAKTRGRYVLLMDTFDEHPSVDPAQFAAIWEEAKRRLTDARLVKVGEWGLLARFELYQLTESGGD